MLISNVVLMLNFSVLIILVIFLGYGSVKFRQHLAILEKIYNKSSIRIDHNKINFQTGLPNRASILESVKSILKSAHQHKISIAFLFIDLDHFKHINNALGYAIGDLILKEIASRLVASIDGEENIVGHMDSDEFCIVIKNCQSRSKEISAMANDVLKIIASINQMKGNEVSITGSLGISIYPDTACNAEELLRQAECANNEAKNNGKNNYRFFTAEMNKKVLANIELARDLKKALLGNEQLYLCYQPKVDIATGKIIGSEALIRWLHPTKGNIGPDVFISIAEESGVIMEIGNFIIRKACQDLKVLQALGFPELQVAVNLSAQQFSKGDIAEVIAAEIYNSGIEAKHLELELTESLVMENPEKSLLMLRVLKSMGIELALDDFGTGYSSLSHLKKFPLNSLKIDQSFVRDLDKDKNNQIMVGIIINMAESLALRVVVEGVERKEELKIIQQKSSKVKIQGYLFSKPLQFSAYQALLLKNQAEPFDVIT
jgi:diguanylate cyclase (GGDEF)-like protein